MIEKRAPPPPPPKRVPAAPKKTERAFVAQWAVVVARLARRVTNPDRAGMTPADVQQDLYEVLVAFRRKWMREHHADPDDALVRHALNWRVAKLSRQTRTLMRTATVGDPELIERAPDPGFGIETLYGSVRQREYERAVEVLRLRLEPTAVALLWAHHVEAVPVRVLAEVIGLPAKDVSLQLRAAREDAHAFLASLGLTP